MKIQLPEEFRFLNFNRFNVHTQAGALTDEQIEKTKTILAGTQDNALKRLLSKKLGIYYAFRLRSPKEASEYFKLCLTSIDDKMSLAYAQVGAYLGFSKAIDGGYTDRSLFEKSLTIYQSLERKTEQSQVEKLKLHQAFSNRYLALIKYRLGIAAHNEGDDLGAYLSSIRAIEAIEKVIQLQNEHHANPIDLAESLHLRGVFCQRRGQLAEAKENLENALAIWERVRSQTGAVHPIQFVTMQSLASIQMQDGNAPDAIRLLLKTYEEQTQYFETETQADIAKTQHFLGEAYKANGELLKSLTAYNTSLAIKQSLELSKILVNTTQEAIDKLQKDAANFIPEINHEFQFHWNEPTSFNTAKTMLHSAEQLLLAVHRNGTAKLQREPYLALSKLNYKVATFYLHTTYREPANRLELAIEYLMEAKKSACGISCYWVLNQLACAYQQKMQAGDLSYAEKLHEIVDEVVHHPALPEKNRQTDLLISFAYCTKAQGFAAIHDFKAAIHYYRKALDLYESRNEGQSYQYLRAKNVYARYLVQAKQFDVAEKIYSELDEAWKKKENSEGNLFAGRFYVNYANFLLDVKKDTLNALEKFRQAKSILTLAGAQEFAAEVEKSIQSLQENATQRSPRESPSAPYFHKPPSPSTSTAMQLSLDTKKPD